MSVPATQLHTQPPLLEAGTILSTPDRGTPDRGTPDRGVSDGRFTVGANAGEYRAERAVSCLVEPEKGDFVLLSIMPTGGAYVLAVLSRESDDVTLSVEGDFRIRPKHGVVALASSEGVHIASSKDVSVVSGQLTVNAVEGVIGLQQLSYVGRFVKAEVEKIKLFAGSMDSWLDRFSQKAKRVYRTVEQLDQLKAGRVDYSAKKTMRLHGQHTLMTAEELVKLDGEQIHMG